ncbi:hypothetical protein D3C85_1648290 [compost metagenome]
MVGRQGCRHAPIGNDQLRGNKPVAGCFCEQGNAKGEQAVNHHAGVEDSVQILATGLSEVESEITLCGSGHRALQETQQGDEPGYYLVNTKVFDSKNIQYHSRGIQGYGHG